MAREDAKEILRRHQKKHEERMKDRERKGGKSIDELADEAVQIAMHTE